LRFLCYNKNQLGKYSCEAVSKKHHGEAEFFGWIMRKIEKGYKLILISMLIGGALLSATPAYPAYSLNLRLALKFQNQESLVKIYKSFVIQQQKLTRK